MGKARLENLTIAAGETVSSAVDCTDCILRTLRMPTEWSPAVLSFQLSPDGLQFFDLVDAVMGTEVQINVTPNSIVVIPDGIAHPMKFIRLRSGSAAEALVQEAERVFTLTVEEVSAAPAAAAPPPSLKARSTSSRRASSRARRKK